MEKRIISIKDAPAAIGPYSQGVVIGNLVYFSGQIAIDARTGELTAGSVTEQTSQIFKNLKVLLAAANLTFMNVIKTTVFLTDMSKFGEVNAEYAKYFSVNPPARSTVGVASLPKGAQVEIEVIAAL